MASNAADAAGRGLSDFTLEMLFVVTLSASAFQMGLLNALGSVAFVVATIPAGYLVDKISALRILRLGLGAKVVLLACLLMLTVTQTLNIAVGLVLATLLGFCNVFSETSQVAAVPEVDRGRKSLGALIARLAAADQAIGIIIPAVAGTLFALLGAAPLLAASLTLALAALGLAYAIHRARDPHKDAPAVDASLRGDVSFFGGVRYLFSNRTLVALTFSVMFCNLGLAIGSAVEGIFVVNELQFGAQGYGVYAAVGGIGGLIGAAVSSRLAQRFTPVQLAVPSVAGQIVFSGFVLLANFTDRHWAMILLVVHALGWGVVVIVFNIAVSTWVVEVTPEDLLGRLLSARRLFTFGVVPLGGLLGGYLGSTFGIYIALAAWVGSSLMGLLCFAVFKPRSFDSQLDDQTEAVAE
ncbi:MFS transporter [Glutamicibacter uratoxydans]|uniref:MFS transporter n=3 Tax=Glutamicibacter uratoxydans TaxID=43667 RepID=A0A4Y4DSH0_GLUUR|nr:MFS transporter [Glutamicibacter uratoxydans]GED06844.1 MFS transporter [Glutamicibacter uratoxydans]